ncbi:MAG: hypothetical protein GX589_09830 [Deltaproteobacteria bacterium]|nr:hypothetical protein [Deltaproteobacteria bacterium]
MPPHRTFKRTLALFLGLGLGATLSVLSLRLMADLREEAAYRAFAKQLQLSNYYDSERRLGLMFSAPRLFDWAKNLELSTNRISLAEKRTSIQELHNIIRMLDQHDYVAATRRFNSLRDGQLTNLLWAMPEDSFNPQLLADIQRNFGISQTLTTELSQLETTMPTRVAENLKIIEQQELVTHEIQEKLAKLFSLPIPPLQPGEKRPTPTIYADGVLKGLPVLPQIPQPLMSLMDLKQGIEAAGGEVIVQGKDAPRRFNEKLKNLRLNTKTSLSHINAAQEALASLKEQLQTSRLAVLQSGEPLKLDLTKLLLVLCQPRSSSMIAQVSDLFFGPRPS